MPLVQAKCTNCGANLEVDNTKEAAICEFCGTPYIVEKAINNYNTVNNIQAGVVNIYGGSSADFVIKAGKLIKYNGASTDVIIPNSVKEIDSKAFENCDGITSVTLPDSLTVINDEVFKNCTSLTNVIIPNSVTSIGMEAFYCCSSLISIAIPDSVTEINARAFCRCSSLTNIEIPNSITSIGIEAFHGCSNLTNITIPNSVTCIKNLAFSECSNLTNITIPDSVTSIGQYVFSGCSSLTTINASKEWKFEHNSSLNTKNIGCYIATAVYGSYDCPPVWTLRRYRDNILASTWYGRIFIHTYYIISPTMVKWFGHKTWFKNMLKPKLDRIVKNLNDLGIENTPYKDINW